LGVATYVLVKGEAVNYFVAGKTFPLWMVAITLGAASVDSNVLLGNVDLSYKFSFWDGVVLPLGLAMNLFLNAFTLGPKLNAEPNMLTLPDAIGNRYGVIVEVLCSMCCIVSFLMLLAGNLVGTGVITSYVWGTTQTVGIWIAAVLVWSFTVAGGLFSIAYTDVALGVMGW
jgi:Na+/proline symporter